MYDNIKKPLLIIPFLISTALLLSGCGTIQQNTNNNNHQINNIMLGELVNVTSNVAPSSDGTIKVQNFSSPLNGLEIKVPNGSYPNQVRFSLSYYPITGHQLGETFTPISPLIHINNNGTISDEELLVKIPTVPSDNQFIMAFYYDVTTGKLEGIPIDSQTTNSITVKTIHFSNIIISGINTSLLPTNIRTGYLPGRDDWQFVNRGSFIEPEGHCAGQSISSMWYFYEKRLKGYPSLYGYYDNNLGEATPDFWPDDSWGYRFSSITQQDLLWNSKYRQRLEALSKINDTVTFRAFAYSMMITGEPQFITAYDSVSKSGHALVAYGISGNAILIADPNYPGVLGREIRLVNGTFAPYNSGSNADAIASGNEIAFDIFSYYAKAAVIDWNKLTNRWLEFENETIGDDSFPEYIINYKKANGSKYQIFDEIHTDQSSIWIGEDFTDTQHAYGFYLFKDLSRIRPITDNYFSLDLGVNHLSMYLVGKIDTTYKFVDFVAFDVFRYQLLFDSKTFTGNAGSSILLSTIGGFLPDNPKFEWNFGDGSAPPITTTTSTTHTYLSVGTFPITTTLYDANTNTLLATATASISISPMQYNLAIDPDTLDGDINTAYAFSIQGTNIPSNPKFEWDFNDGSAIVETTLTSITHTFTTTNTFTITVTLFNNDTNQEIASAISAVTISDPSQPDQLAIIQSYPIFYARFNGKKIFHRTDYVNGQITSESDHNENESMKIPYRTSESFFDITWNGVNFYGETTVGNYPGLGLIDKIEGTMSSDGTTLISLTATYQSFNEPNSLASNNITQIIEFTNIPIITATTSFGSSYLSYYTFDGAEQYVNSIYSRYESYSKGKLVLTDVYSSTNWSLGAGLSIYFKKVE